MNWITRRGLHVDRTASAWLIKSHIDPAARFMFVAPDADISALEGCSFDMRGADYTHREGKCTFEVLLDAYSLAGDAALCAMGRIVREADVPSRGRRLTEASGLDAIMRGFQLGVPDDEEKIRLTGPVYDALYTYCRERIAEKPRSRATPRPRLTYRQRFVRHVEEETAANPNADA